MFSWLSALFKNQILSSSEAVAVELESTSILENALDAIVGVDANNRIIFWNLHAETIFGWTKQAVLGKDMTTLIVPPELQARHVAGMKRFIDTGVPRIQNKRIEIPGMRKTGEIFPMELTVSSVKTSDGSYRFYSFMRDVTAQKESIQRLKQTALDLDLKSSALENSLNGFDIISADGKFIYVNKAYVKMWGFDSAEEVIGTSPANHCADPSTPLKIISQLKATGQCDIEFLARRKDGSTFDVRMLALLAHDANGNEIYPTTSIDITQQKRAADELRKSGERYQQVFANSPMPMWLFDPVTYDFVDVNETAVRVYGYSREEFLKMKVTQIRFKEDLARFEQAMAVADRTKHYQSEGHFRHIKKDGTIIFVQPSTHDIELDGRKLQMAAIADITARVQFESQQKELLMKLDEAKRDAERANQLKSAFLANMSHEIRTPLGALLGFADLLRDPSLTKAEHNSYIDILIRNGQSLSGIINDILDLSKVEAGHLSLEFANCSPSKVAEEVVSLLSVKAREKNLIFDFESEDSTPDSIITDPLRMRQILLNLLSNSIKFTQFGVIHLKSYGCKTDDGRSAVCFEVTDTGIGIPPEHVGNVFEMFVQGDGSMARRFGGTGLGLALSRRLARSLGGDVSLVRTEQGKGSTFKVVIEDQPQLRNSQATGNANEVYAPQDLPADALKGVKVLVVDDSPDNQSLIWTYLTKRGASVESAENGLVGYQKALKGSFDVVIMDIQMPEMDGYTATQQLREAGYQKPIIALTAHVLSDVREKCLNVGCTSHLSKPINQKQLIATVAELVRA